MTLTITLVITFMFGIVAFFLLYIYGMRGVATYRGKVLTRVDEGLQKSFVFMDPRRLMLLSGATIVGCMIVGFITLGYPGLVLGAVLGGAAPNVLMRYIDKRRREQFVYQLPDALRAMAGSLRAGGTAIRAIELIAQRQPNPIAQEFGLVLAEHKLGRDINEALNDVQVRMGCEELRLVNSAISISRSVGGNLADSLDALARTLQSKAQVEGKIKALTSMGRMQGWVVGMLPVVVGYLLYLQRPEEMTLMFTTLMGWVVVAVIAVLMLAAALTIRKIVNIDV